MGLQLSSFSSDRLPCLLRDNTPNSCVRRAVCELRGQAIGDSQYLLRDSQLLRSSCARDLILLCLRTLGRMLGDMRLWDPIPQLVLPV